MNIDAIYDNLGKPREPKPKMRQFREGDIPVIARMVVDALPLASARLDGDALYDRVQAILLAKSRPA